MIGIIILLAVSWALLHFMENENLSVLGYSPIDKRLGQFFLGILAVFVLRGIITMTVSWMTDGAWVYNALTPWEKFGEAALYHLRSALTEELAFRGALLYILMKRFGAITAILLSSLAFGIYHIFSFELSQWVVILHVVVTTGLTGMVWAQAYVRSRSVLPALGMHFAWNYFSALFQTGGPYGRLLYFQTESSEPEMWFPLYFIRFFLPILLMFLYVRFLVKKEPGVKYIEVG